MKKYLIGSLFSLFVILVTINVVKADSVIKLSEWLAYSSQDIIFEEGTVLENDLEDQSVVYLVAMNTPNRVGTGVVFATIPYSERYTMTESRRFASRWGSSSFYFMCVEGSHQYETIRTTSYERVERCSICGHDVKFSHDYELQPNETYSSGGIDYDVYKCKVCNYIKHEKRIIPEEEPSDKPVSNEPTNEGDVPKPSKDNLNINVEQESSANNETQDKDETEKETLVVEAEKGETVSVEETEEATVIEAEQTIKTKIVIPKSFDINGVQYPITELIKGMFSDNPTATIVDIPNTITKINDKAFAGTNIKVVNLSVKNIEKLKVSNNAFKNSKVEKVKITLKKQPTKEEKQSLKNKFKKAGIDKKNVKIKIK